MLSILYGLPLRRITSSRVSGAVPSLAGAMSAEAWIALATYPWNWAPILDHERDSQAGFYFGIGPLGQVGLELSVEGRWQTCRSERVLELRRFTHLAAVFEPTAGITLYADGSPVKRCAIDASAAPAEGLESSGVAAGRALHEIEVSQRDRIEGARIQGARHVVPPGEGSCRMTSSCVSP